jgi:crotonobetainyl-CoA:carnitine CoA-transferase CaiB-like acyl-CoA transferase
VGPAGYGRQIDPNRQPFPTADGHISIVPYTDDSLSRIFALLGSPERLEEERFSTPRLRAVNVSEIYAEIAKLTPARTTAAWMELLTAAQIPAMPVRDLADMLEDPHLRQSGFFRRKTHPTEGDHYEMSPPIRYGARPAADRRPAPLVGQDSEAIRAELGDPA